MYVSITGRQPEISIAELESLLGSESILETTKDAVLLSGKPEFSRLGGSLKLLKTETKLNNTDNLVEDIAKIVEDHIKSHGVTSKLSIGLSIYGSKVKPNVIFKVKKAMRQKEYSIRVVDSKANNQLSTAEVLHNKLYSTKKGLELSIVRFKSATYLCTTVGVQDIDSYTDRDRMRPMRDSKVGMLPPKLAQTMINLADPEPGSTVLDPFCGTGVVLQEALLMGFGAYGTDISPRMIKYSEENLAWLRSNFSTATQTSNVEVGDAKTHKWTKDFQAIAGETYLGEAFVNVPKSFEVEKQCSEVNAIIEQFLVNLGSQIKSGTKLCVGVPQWQLKNQTFSLPVIDNLQSLGYTWERFSHVDITKLVYRRPGQTVGRQLLTLVRK